MFNLKKFKRTVQSALETPKDPNVLIAEIHNEFDTSTERLLNEAKDILSKIDNATNEKVNRLKNLGFRQSKAVSENEETILKEKKSKEVADSIMYFNQWYPYNKFITEEEVKSICLKYKLVCAEVRLYKGDVPDKNLLEIESFKLREEDKLQRSNHDDYLDSRFRQVQMNSLSNFGGLGQSFGFRPTSSSLTDFNPPKEIKFRSITPELKICAFAKDFDTSGMIVSEGYKLINIPDPIVLQPVKGGYLIVSKWGLEAEDKDLVNEKMN